MDLKWLNYDDVNPLEDLIDFQQRIFGRLGLSASQMGELAKSTHVQLYQGDDCDCLYCRLRRGIDDD